MKKNVLLLVVAAIMTFVACSDSSISGNQNLVRKESTNLELFYLSMIESESYIISRETLLNFVANLNFEGDVSDINTEAKMFSWISTNLSKTGFSSLSEAQYEWNNVVEAGSNSFQNNISFYEAINGKPQDFRDLVIQYDPILFEPMSGCDQVCKDNFTLCAGNAATGYADSVDATFTAYENQEISAQTAYLDIQFAEAVFIIASQLCAGYFVECCQSN